MSKQLLKFLACGSVDDGKSTLIGHMLYDSKLLFTDQKKALELESSISGKLPEGELDYSILLDGLTEEREAGITIDVAYRYFSSKNRSFIVADAPGHEEYTRNMAVAASFADLAVILIDASKGVLLQTKRHSRICRMMGISSFVFAVNKMDLVGYNQHTFNSILKDIEDLCHQLEITEYACIPVSARVGDNVSSKSDKIAWYQACDENPHINGMSLFEYLETVNIQTSKTQGSVLPVQRVCRPNSTFRGYQGTICSGSIKVGDELSVLPSREKASVSKIICGFNEVDEAVAGQAVTIVLDRELAVTRGDVLESDSSLNIGNGIDVALLWLDKQPLASGRSFYLKIGTKQLLATVLNVKYKYDINTGKRIPPTSIQKNDIISCQLSLSGDIAFDKFSNLKELGSFILIDRVSFSTAACGIVIQPSESSNNIYWHQMEIDRTFRASSLKQNPVTIWFTGLSGSGKSTLANGLEKLLNANEYHTMTLDGDNTRLGLNKDLGFTESDRAENIRRLSEVAKLMNDGGLIVLTAFISPFEADRESASEIIGKENFIEVFVDTPIEECEKRDPKKLYERAKAGIIPNFTGISSRYDIPKAPTIRINTVGRTVNSCVEELYTAIKDRIIFNE
ncbi:MAG: adenylyl-sulfate kinase [Succinivibrio sp.]